MSTAAERCAVCGGPFSQKRVIIDGAAYHERCSIMSYAPHRPEDLGRMQAEIERLRAALKKIADMPPLIQYASVEGKQIVYDAEQRIARKALSNEQDVRTDGL